MELVGYYILQDIKVNCGWFVFFLKFPLTKLNLSHKLNLFTYVNKFGRGRNRSVSRITLSLNSSMSLILIIAASPFSRRILASS